MSANPTAPGASNTPCEYLTVAVNGQTFGIPVLAVQDVLGTQRLTRVPLSPPEVAGALNMRGRIVTAIDLRRRLRMPDRELGAAHMSVVVDQGGEFYSLVVDNVGEVLIPPADAYEQNPKTLDGTLKEVSLGVFRLERDLLMVLDVARILEVGAARAA